MPPYSAVRASDICEALLECHWHHGWRAEKEALFSPRRIDVLAIAPKATEVIAFEIKTSLRDFHVELKNPTKRGTVMRHCSQFYFVVPYGMVMPRNVPEDCGLIYFGCNGLSMIKRSPAQKWELPFETDQRIQIERMERERREEERISEQEWDADLCEAISGQLPRWMLPRLLSRPLRFQFDLQAAAAKLWSVPLVAAVDFDGIPF